uniref:Myb-like domain-containing protein n=1 Tax=Brassica oleracea var. oleracea TaxID=109376 RepID=A0A0D3CWH7_BRAOL
MEKQKSRRLIKNFSNMSLRGTWRKATSLPNGVGESKVYSIDFILIVSIFSLFRRRFKQTVIWSFNPHRSLLPSNPSQPNPIEIGYPSTLNFGASEIPPFSSQQTDAPNVREDTPVACRKRRKWTPADDEVLISAWLNTSKDAVVGNEQKSGTFRKRVESGEPREHLHCKQRWHKINNFTNKFCGAYAAAERHISSGQNNNDVLKVAHDIFYSDHNTKFNLEHAWCVLRYEHKWLSLNTPKPSGSSKRKAGETCSQTSSTTVGDHEYMSICEMKKEDLMMKEKLSKLAIPDTLLAKKESLSEAEEVVKNKLLAHYSQPSDSEEYGGEIADSGYSSMKELIRRDQAELSINYGAPAQYPPQPEVEFGFPQTCYCGDERSSFTQYDVFEFQQGEDVDDTFSVDMPTNIGNTIDRRASILNRQAHQQLKNDLIENIWAKFGHLPNNI